MACLVCRNPTVDKCHIKSKGAGGCDSPDNIMALCRKHHQEQHKIGIVSFLMKYDQPRIYVFSRGWEIVDEFGQAKLRRSQEARPSMANPQEEVNTV